MAESKTIGRTGLIRSAAAVAMAGALVAGVLFGGAAGASAATPEPTPTAGSTPSTGAAASTAASDQGTSTPASNRSTSTTPATDPAAATPVADPATSTPAPEQEPASEPAESASELPDPHFDLEGVVVTSFRPGDIITDGNMYDGGAMTAAQVQAFLTAQAPPSECTNGNCISGKTFPSTGQPANAECTAYAGAASESAASIITKAGKACGVSQRALLVLVQKESQVVDATAPTNGAYDAATGYECRDDGTPCDPAYKGFANQVYNAARQLKNYQISPRYPIGSPSAIQYAPGTACGTGSVTIKNKATAALYAYTPYTPNADALDPDKGPDACTSYGNLNFWVIYTDWFGYPHIDVDRLQGADRFAVSAAIAEEAYPSGSSTVFLANGAGYADALSAGPAAVEKSAPLLLTQADALPDVVASAITDDTKLATVVIVGGPNSVSPAVEAQLTSLRPGVTIVRLGGADRYEVSRNVAAYAFPKSAGGASGAYVATGANFPDALSASGAGGHAGKPVVLVNGSAGTIDPDTSAALTALGVKKVTVAGGPNSVSSGVLASLKSQFGSANVTRISGADRYEASLNINQDAYDTSSRVFFATGANFPDALAGSALAGSLGAPLIVVHGDCVPQAVRLSLNGFQADRVTLLGGPASLDASVQSLRSCG
ncbi:cell wall-binding repeat-containing protein [Herbiconiux sp. YIM B11900]|uniref:cell wall-binding repeat-containing protein n=1 Tax=Herbiconiux sp. YIM B11900 TaxID=3404131 RepID=UPI003F849D13